MRFFVALVLALVLHGCATLAPPPAPLPQLTAVPKAFEMNGRIAVRQDQRSDIAKLRWVHREAGDVWTISSPIGNEVARIESEPGGVVLSEAGAEPQRAASFEELTEKLLGVPLDPRTLAAWLHGDTRATPGQWRITIDETQPAGSVTLARRITATRGDTVVRLVVDEYRALPE